MGARHAWVAALDTVLLFVWIALQEPGDATGLELHEWLGAAFIPLFILHLVLSWNWIVTTWRRAWSDRSPRARINFLLNLSLFVMTLIVIVSGFVISEYALPAVGVSTRGTQRWEQFHNFTSSLLTPVIGLHLALNWSWIKGALRRYVMRTATLPASEPEDFA